MFELKEFHKKHHTLLLVIETLILLGIMFVLTHSFNVEMYDDDDVSNVMYLFDISFKWYYCIPFILSSLQIVFIGVIILMRDKMENPIMAKKTVPFLFYYSLVCLALLALSTFAFASLVAYDGTYYYYYAHGVYGVFACLCQVLISFDIYVWRSEFGLEKFYGTR